MGIETALIALGASAEAAAAVAPVVGAVGTAVVGAAASKALAPKPQAQTQVAPITAAEKPQAAQDVDLNAIQKKNALAASAAGALSGNNSTLLSGSQGVNSGGLNLGQSTLLGQ